MLCSGGQGGGQPTDSCTLLANSHCRTGSPSTRIRLEARWGGRRNGGRRQPPPLLLWAGLFRGVGVRGRDRRAARVLGRDAGGDGQPDRVRGGAGGGDSGGGRRAAARRS